MKSRITRIVVALAVLVSGVSIVPALMPAPAQAYLHVAACQASLMGQNGTDNDINNYGAIRGIVFNNWLNSDHDGDYSVSQVVLYSNGLGSFPGAYGWCTGVDDTHIIHDEVNDGFPPAWYPF